MLHPVHLRHLLVDAGSHPRGQPHLSAVSGLVQVGAWLYVVADDEHHLGMLPAAGHDEPVRLLRIQSGDLPHGKARRKKHKPDLETLVFLPAQEGNAQGLLLALGSGSRPNRQQAFLLEMNVAGEVQESVQTVDLSPLYEPLRREFADLNIEGAFVAGGHLRLLQRGNKGDARNACIDYPLAEMQAWISGKREAPPAAISITSFTLGEVDGVPFGFTDGANLPDDEWIFSAVAEDTDDSYADGACVASAIGWVDADGSLRRFQQIAGAPKVEGIAMAADGKLLLVTDSDDPATASDLLCIS